jgi:hypothetical protein
VDVIVDQRVAAASFDLLRHTGTFDAESATKTVGSLDPRLLRGISTRNSEIMRAVRVLS